MGEAKWGQSCHLLSVVAPWAAALAQEQDVIGTHPMTAMQVSSILLDGGTSFHVIGVPLCLGDRFSRGHLPC